MYLKLKTPARYLTAIPTTTESRIQSGAEQAVRRGFAHVCELHRPTAGWKKLQDAPTLHMWIPDTM